MNEKRYILTQKPTKKSGSRATSKTTTRSSRRTRTEIDRIIKEQGSTPPDWFESAVMNYPDTLDLSWPLKAEGGWNSRKNMGQFLWDVVYPNPDRWQGGLKLVHHCTTLHKGEPKLLTRDMRTIGGIYFRLFQDYPRAAFWLRKGGVGKSTNEGVMLAECYWRLGSTAMALDMLDSRTLPVGAIKLFGDMRETRQALKWVDVYVRAKRPHEAYLLGGDALRKAGQYDRAVAMYEKVLSAQNARNKQYDDRFRARAKESIEAIRLFDQADVTRVSDGTYRGVSTGYNGQLEVAVKVSSGRIESVEVTRHREKQFYSALDDTPRQVLEDQSIRNIDATSRATITSQAIVNATARALAEGSR